MARDISNSADILDSRDIIARIEELQDERDNYQPDTDDGIPEDDDVIALTDEQRHKAWAEANDDDANELRVLLALQEEASASPDWPHGEALIRDSYFEEYARDLADDCGMVDKKATWPNTFIAWEAASEALKQDYMSVDFDGVEYWIRA